MKILKTANYEQAEWERFCKEAGIWDNIKGVGRGIRDLGGGVYGLISNLLKAGVSGAEIVKALYDIFGNVLKMPLNDTQPPLREEEQGAEYSPNMNEFNRNIT